MSDIALALIADIKEGITTLTKQRDALREENHRLREALIWCSAAPEFNEGGEAREGWLNGPAKLLAGDAR